MLKFLKYEFKKTYKFNLMILIATIIFNLLKNFTENLSHLNNTMIDLIKYISASTINVIPFIILIYYINNFKKELYSGSGYLTFSLPLKGRVILFSKILIQLLIGFVYGIINIILNFNVVKIFILLIDNTHFEIFLLAINIFLLNIFIIITIYLCITVNHYFFKSKNKYFLWLFLFVFIIVSLIYFYIYFGVFFISAIEQYTLKQDIMKVILSTNILLACLINFIFFNITAKILDNHLELA